jgi:hypothetical protein
MRRALSCVLCAIFVFIACPAGKAQGTAANPGWETCLQAPTRTCILDQARIDALSVEPSVVRAGTLVTIAEAQAAVGDLQAAWQTAQSIPPDQAPHVTALRSIAAEQVQLGMTTEVRETVRRAHQLANALTDQLARAESLQSIGLAETESGMTTEAAEAFRESLPRPPGF